MRSVRSLGLGGEGELFDAFFEGAFDDMRDSLEENFGEDVAEQYGPLITRLT